MKQIYLFFALTLAAFACNRPLDEDETIIYNGKPEFNLSLFEQRDAQTGKPTFGLWVESVALFECDNYLIVSEKNISPQQISVTLNGIEKPQNCQSATATAKAFISIGVLPDGNYPIEIALRNVVHNAGTLSIKNGQYTLDMPEAKGISIKHYTLSAIPENLFWGYVETPGEAAIIKANALLADLKKQSEDADLPTGHYGYFSVSGTGLLFLNDVFVPKIDHQIFVRKMSASPNDIKATLQAYRTGNQSLVVKCLSTVGEL